MGRVAVIDASDDVGVWSALRAEVLDRLDVEAPCPKGVY